MDQLPDGFAITLYHIVYMYANNITVISKMDQKIVYSQSYDRLKPLRGIDLDYRRHRLMAYQFKECVMLTSLRGEDCEAWKHYIKSD